MCSKEEEDRLEIYDYGESMAVVILLAAYVRLEVLSSYFIQLALYFLLFLFSFAARRWEFGKF